MRLNIDLSALHRAVASFDEVVCNPIEPTEGRIGAVAKELGDGIGRILGEDIPLEEIDGTDGILNYNGQQVLLYIPDQGDNILDVLKDGKIQKAKRIHIAECSTLEQMRNTGRFGRYDVISRMDGLFPVFGINPDSGENQEGLANLGVCKNCLKVLNYKRYDDVFRVEKQDIFENFNFENFFETYSSYFKSLPEQSSSKGSGYTPNWSSISSRYRRQLNYHCEHCGVDLSSETRLLHVHHINGNKTDNRKDNLRGLCADCHKKQPHHGHLHVNRDDTLLINELRRSQNKFDVFEYDKLNQFADTALDGLISKCQKYSLPTPDLGIMVKSGLKVTQIDLVWPRQKVAVLINTENKPMLEDLGWTVFSAASALKEFEEFQRKVR